VIEVLTDAPQRLREDAGDLFFFPPHPGNSTRSARAGAGAAFFSPEHALLLALLAPLLATSSHLRSKRTFVSARTLSSPPVMGFGAILEGLSAQALTFIFLVTFFKLWFHQVGFFSLSGEEKGPGRLLSAVTGSQPFPV